jgi:hypothetical protein
MAKTVKNFKMQFVLLVAVLVAVVLGIVFHSDKVEASAECGAGMTKFARRTYPAVGVQPPSSYPAVCKMAACVPINKHASYIHMTNTIPPQPILEWTYESLDLSTMGVYPCPAGIPGSATWL